MVSLSFQYRTLLSYAGPTRPNHFMVCEFNSELGAKDFVQKYGSLTCCATIKFNSSSFVKRQLHYNYVTKEWLQ